MCMILNAEQFMGAVAFSFCQNERKSISFSDFYKLEKRVARELRTSKQNAILSISKDDVYSTIKSYRSLYRSTDKDISFIDEGYLYKNYFLGGITKDLTSTLTKMILE